MARNLFSWYIKLFSFWNLVKMFWWMCSLLNILQCIIPGSCFLRCIFMMVTVILQKSERTLSIIWHPVNIFCLFVRIKSIQGGLSVFLLQAELFYEILSLYTLQNCIIVFLEGSWLKSPNNIGDVFIFIGI